MKHEIKVLEEETALLNSQLEDALRLKDISQAQLEEALDALKSEREQKHGLRKELAHHLSLSDSVYGAGAHLALAAVDQLRFATETDVVSTAATTPTANGSVGPLGLPGSSLSSPVGDDLGRCNGHHHGNRTTTNGAADFGLRNGTGRKGVDATALPPVADLFSELNLSEMQKLKQQLMQVSPTYRTGLKVKALCSVGHSGFCCALATVAFKTGQSAASAS